MSYDPFMLNDIFNFTWEPVQGRLNGILRGYKVRWKQVKSSNDYIRNIINSTTNSASNRRRRRSASYIIREIRLTNLSLYTNYSFEVAAITVAVGKFSDKYYFMSQEGGKHFLINLAIHFSWVLVCFVVLAAMRIYQIRSHGLQENHNGEGNCNLITPVTTQKILEHILMRVFWALACNVLHDHTFILLFE